MAQDHYALFGRLILTGKVEHGLAVSKYAVVLFLRADDEFLPLAESCTGRNEVTRYHVLLHTFQTVYLTASLSTFVVSWNDAAEMKLLVCKAARVMPWSICVDVAGMVSRT